jgi:hypothetical protein
MIMQPNTPQVSSGFRDLRTQRGPLASWYVHPSSGRRLDASLELIDSLPVIRLSLATFVLKRARWIPVPEEKTSSCTCGRSVEGCPDVGARGTVRNPATAFTFRVLPRLSSVRRRPAAGEDRFASCQDRLKVGLPCRVAALPHQESDWTTATVLVQLSGARRPTAEHAPPRSAPR